MRGFLFLEMQMQGKKRSKIGHLARLFNAADAFAGAKSTHKSNYQDTLGCPDNLFMRIFVPENADAGQQTQQMRFQGQNTPVNRMVRTP
ncbi:hypothetical protein LVJ83_05965 [Uruburuella testudinis]|uniref:Uncharacterized protein n=1 Tax=Uruburuella testudinis TaxID=1282863 RepID=A0ABY4DWJ5_9NEIS|nr:hypothetical protein [Uruburuella testudinis]UOO83002.1 hypothetical protein LVJ83_05965 [Uruburuella testudinis]